MATRTPTIEVIIRDEVSVAMQRMQQRVRSEVARVSFAPLEAGFKNLERAAHSLRREFSSLLGLAGLGTLLGGGFVAGLC